MNNNNDDCHEFLHKLKFYAPDLKSFFYFVSDIINNYVLNILINWLLRYVNELNIDIFAFNSPQSFKHLHVSLTLR